MPALTDWQLPAGVGAVLLYHHAPVWFPIVSRAPLVVIWLEARVSTVVVALMVNLRDVPLRLSQLEVVVS